MDLDFDPTLPADVRTDLMNAAHGVGVPLWQLELLGQDEVVARDFASAVRAGHGPAYLKTCDWARLEDVYEARKRARATGFWTRRALGVGVPEVLPVLISLGPMEKKRNNH